MNYTQEQLNADCRKATENFQKQVTALAMDYFNKLNKFENRYANENGLKR